jgi:hypothetical protein
MKQESNLIMNLRWKVKVKGKVSLCLTKHHAMKTYWGSGGLAPRILDLGTRWRRDVSFSHRPLYPQGKNPLYPLERKLDGPQGRSFLEIKYRSYL